MCTVFLHHLEVIADRESLTIIHWNTLLIWLYNNFCYVLLPPSIEMGRGARSLLDDINLINTLAVSKETSIAVTEQVEVAEEKKEKIKKAREEYIPCGLRAAILFFVLNDLVSVDPMYQFSLEAYVILFKQSIERYAEKNPMVTESARAHS